LFIALRKISIMSAADLMARIDGARGGHQRATDLLAQIRSGSEPAEVPPPPEDDGGMSGSDIGHGILEVIGYVPLIGTVTNVANAIWYVAEGEYENAALSVVSAVPIVGPIAKVIRRGVIAAQAVAEAYRAGTGNEEPEPGIPALRFRDPLPVIGAPVPGLPGSHYGEPRDHGSTNARARAYDARVNGNDTGLAVYLDNPGSGSSDPDNPVPGMGDTEFDWVEYGPNGEITLLDAKHYPSGGFWESAIGDFDDRIEKTLEQADRQIAAMEHTGIDPNNIRIEWRVAGPEATAILQDLFRDNGIDIRVVPAP
jgi:hypothetical protein